MADMTDPDNAASQDTFGDRVSLALKAVTRKDGGKLTFPEDTSEEVVFAATAELRRRDTQAEFTRTKQAQLALEAEKAELLEQLGNDFKVELSDDQVAELEELKFSDPNTWRCKLNNLENEARNKRGREVRERLKEVSTKGTETAELERRKQILLEFQAENPGLVIDDDVITNDIPPRITKRLQDNAVSFEVFLQEACDYINAGKVVATTEKPLGQPDLGKAGGGDTPSDDAVGSESRRSYEKEIY